MAYVLRLRWTKRDRRRQTLTQPAGGNFPDASVRATERVFENQGGTPKRGTAAPRETEAPGAAGNVSSRTTRT